MPQSRTAQPFRGIKRRRIEAQIRVIQTPHMKPQTYKVKRQKTNRLPSKPTTSQQRRYNVAATSRRCSDVVTTFLRRWVFARLGLSVGNLPGLYPVLNARTLTFNFDAAPNYKYMFGPYRIYLLHLWKITVKHIKSKNTLIKQSKVFNRNLKPGHKNTTKGPRRVRPHILIVKHRPSETD